MRKMTCVVLALSFVFTAAAATHREKTRAMLPVAPLNLGDTNADLLFTPLNPCRIIDTRLGGGFMLGGTTRSFKVAGVNAFQTQGGILGGCGVPIGATSSLINFIAVAPDGLGNLRGSAYPNSIPTTGSIINYQLLNPTLNIANAVAFPICDPSIATCDFDITLFTNGGGTHVVADVLGYFKRFPKEQTITALTPGTGLTGGGTSGPITLGIDTTGAVNGQALTFDGTGVGWVTPPQGTITGVTAGPGLGGGGTSGNVSLNVNFAGTGAANTAARSDHTHYLRTIIVSPAGSDVANGNGLLAALAGITDAAATKPYLLKIEPGIYDFVNQSLAMKPYVDVEGSGERVTTLKRIGGSGVNQATVIGADNAEIRFLTALVASGGTDVTAFWSFNTSPSVFHATFLASGGSTNNYGMYLDGGSPTLAWVTSSALGPPSLSAAATGIQTANSIAVRLYEVVATSNSTSNSGDSFGVAFNTTNTGTVTFDSVTAIAVATQTLTAGIHDFDGNAVMNDVYASGSNSTYVNYGLHENGTGGATPQKNIRINHSTLIGSTNTIISSNGITTWVGASQLAGGNALVTGGIALIHCFACYDENYLNAGGLTVCP